MTTWRHLLRPLRALLAPLAGALLLAGCRPVPAWQRESLARRELAAPSFPAHSRTEGHVHDIREGTSGATGQVGGGCGCN